MLGRLRAGRRALLGWTFTVMLGATAIGLGGAASATGALPSNCVQSGEKVTCSFAYSGAEQSLALPAGVSSIGVTAVGAPGGDSGGNGANVQATIPLTGTTELYVEVGGPGEVSGGFNGGGSAGDAGGGGGASDVRTCSASVCSLSSSDTRLVVAGGGGGGAGTGCPAPPAGQAGDVTATGAGNGGNGSDSSADCGSSVGAGGNAGFGGTAGGQGGSGTTDFPCPGGNGSLGQGGSDPTTTCDPTDAGGGGGGGYWGGGAGGEGRYIAGGGGAGSSYWVPGATNTSMSEDTIGTPRVVITYTAPATTHPDLSLTNRAAPNPVVRGHKLTYTIKPANTGKATADGVTLTDQLPASVRFVSASSPNRCKHSGGRNGMGGTLTCTLGSFTAGKTATIELAVTPTKAGSLSDTAKVMATNVKPDANDAATAKAVVKNP